MVHTRELPRKNKTDDIDIIQLSVDQNRTVVSKLDRVPDELREGIFEKLFEVAEIAKFSLEKVQAYERKPPTSPA